jgi:hypothetical protein
MFKTDEVAIPRTQKFLGAAVGFQYFFRRSHKPAMQADFGDEVLALEFSTRLSWVISEESEWPVKTDGYDESP